ncbi:MAG: glycoside hydrolase family 71/99-like protein [Chryseolinea sp.]
MLKNRSVYMNGVAGMLVLMSVFLSNCNSNDVDKDTTSVKPVVKTNTVKVYMHYMPWFQSKPVSGYWGSHWRMTNRNPEVIDADGKRQIASHYYPLIGPYDSKDPDVIEYHLLLMKYAGVDGILIDWYGSHSNYDYRTNLVNSNAVIDKLDDVGLQFSVVYEEYTAGSIADQSGRSAITIAQEDVTYLQSHYFNSKDYIHIDSNPLLLTFGPRYFKSPTQWDDIFKNVTVKPKFLPLWGHIGYVGISNGSGEYSWVDFTPAFSDLTNFYQKQNQIDLMIGSAYPRFHDYYKEGGVGESYGYVDFNNGQTLQATLDKAKNANLDYLQLVTWNDFGEGTIIEPTLEDQFASLEIIQKFAGVIYGKSELELIYQYYLTKVKYKNDTAAQEKLRQVFNHLASLEVQAAADLLNELP